MPGLKLGKLAATEDPKDLMFAKYVEASNLPPLPAEFGHDALIPPLGWGMLGNDEWGDCAWAGPAHETMLLTTEAGDPMSFSTQGVLSDYSAGTGFDPNAGPSGSNPTDQGSQVRDVLSYRRKTGIVDAQGKRHKIGAFIKLQPGDIEHILQALHIFQVVGIGIQFPEFAMEQFNHGEPWDVVPNAPAPTGGHYVCGVGKHANIDIVTWGALQQMTIAFFEKYCDEAWTYISDEALKDGRNIDGFDQEQLAADLKAVER
jgi:hypothetical protein